MRVNAGRRLFLLLLLAGGNDGGGGDDDDATRPLSTRPPANRQGISMLQLLRRALLASARGLLGTCLNGESMGVYICVRIRSRQVIVD